ncbi:MAG: M20/M25/M40 family metallo-hydrolase [Solirubrobacterales bacterium]
MSERLLQRFIRLCETPSITGDERAVADAVIHELEAAGIEVSEDEKAAEARAGCGNLLARVPGNGEDYLMFCAHLDTVPHAEPIEVIESDGVYRSAGETILGADNKAAVAVLVELAIATSEAERRPAVGIELLLTPAEEDGLRGAHAFDLSGLRAERGYVLDHATPIGEIIEAAPTYKQFSATFSGVEAHAGIRPEAGHSAIEAAAAAIAAMDLGRLDSETTANVGTVEGGSALNVVPGSCRVEGEVRSVSPERAQEVLERTIDACTWAAGESGCNVDVEVRELFRGYRLPRRSETVALAERALSACGVEPHRVISGGGSDANALRAKGFDAVLLANGTTDNHTPSESVAHADLERMLEVCTRLVDEAAAC